MKDIKLSGAFYTPEYVIKLIVELSKNFSTRRILDPACGSAQLLLSVIEGIGAPTEAIGVEINKEVSSLTKSEISKFKLINADFFSVSPEQLGSFDLIVCNPPFGQRIQKEFGRLKLRSIESAFVLASMEFMQPNGYMIFIVPEGILFNESELAFRKYVTEKYSLEAVISIPVGTFQPYTGAKTSVLVLKNSKQREKVFFADYSEQGSLSTIVTNYISAASNENLSQGFWIGYDEVKRKNVWSYTAFRGAIDFESIRRNSKYPTVPLFELIDIVTTGREDEDAILIPRVGVGRDIILKSEMPENKKLQNYFQCYTKNDNIILPYIKIYLNSEAGLRQRSYLTVGSYIPSLSLRSLQPLFVEVPDLATQVELVKTEQELRAIYTRFQGLMQSFRSNPFDGANIRLLTENFEKADIKDLTFGNLLWPLATSYRIATKGSPNVTSQLNSYFKMFEMLTAFNSIVLLSALPSELRVKYDLEIWTAEKSKYEKISFGLWVALYRRLSNLYLKLGKAEKEFYSSLPFGNQDFYQNLIHKKLLGIIDIIPEKRNRIEAHGGIVPEIVAQSVISELHPLLNTVFEMLRTYSSVRLIYPQSMKKNNGLYNIRIKTLEGTHYPFSDENIQSEIDMDTESLYLYDPISHARLKLLPELIKLIQCEKCGNWSVYFFSKVEKDKTRYVSYQNEIHDYNGHREGLLKSFRKT